MTIPGTHVQSDSLYFAYGSNMSAQRMVQRIPAAQKYTTAKLPGYCLRFHKVSTIDRSGKCDIVRSDAPDAVVYGVLYKIHDPDLAALDRIEGNGYRRVPVQVLAEGNGTLTALTYAALHTDPRLRPFGWYREHVLRGAMANGFPEAYIAMLDSIACDEDPDRARHIRELAIYPNASQQP